MPGFGGAYPLDPGAPITVVGSAVFTGGVGSVALPFLGGIAAFVGESSFVGVTLRPLGELTFTNPTAINWGQ